MQNDFFTLESIGTLSSCTAVVFLVTNGLYKACGFNPQWLGLVVSLILALCIVFFNDGSGRDYFVGVINGFLIYATTTGGAQIVGKDKNNDGSGNKDNKPGGGAADANAYALKPKTPRHFNTKWW